MGSGSHNAGHVLVLGEEIGLTRVAPEGDAETGQVNARKRAYRPAASSTPAQRGA